MKKQKWLMLFLVAALLIAAAGCEASPPASPTAVPGAQQSAEPTEDGAADIQEGADAGQADAGNPIVEITMEDGGVIRIQLDSEQAPVTVENFLILVRDGFYDGLTFHRISAGFVIQGGDPLGTGRGGPGHTITGEFSSNGWSNTISHTRGVISMARSDLPDSAGSQFFITLGDATFLDGDYAAFGVVIEGMDVVDQIAAVPTNKETPLEPVVMKTVRVVSETD